MKNKTETSVNLYACGSQWIEDKYLAVLQRNELGIEYYTNMGGSYSDIKSMRNRGEEKNHFNIFSKAESLEKIKSICKSVYTQKVFNKHENILEDIFSLISKHILGDAPKTQLIVEWIEEGGIIPLEISSEPIEILKIGDHTKYFYEVYTSMTYSLEKEQFIFIRSENDLPKNGIDYFCQDYQILGTVLRTESEFNEIAKSPHQQNQENLHPDDKPKFTKVEAKAGEPCDIDGLKTKEVFRQISFGKGFHRKARDIMFFEKNRKSA